MQTASDARAEANARAAERSAKGRSTSCHGQLKQSMPAQLQRTPSVSRRSARISTREQQTSARQTRRASLGSTHGSPAAEDLLESLCKRPAMSCPAAYGLARQKRRLALCAHLTAAFQQTLQSCHQESSLLLTLPPDLLLKVICYLKHSEAGPVLLACKQLKHTAHLALDLHFNYITPHRGACNWPRPPKRHRRWMLKQMSHADTASNPCSPATPKGDYPLTLLSVTPSPRHMRHGSRAHALRALTFKESSTPMHRLRARQSG